MIEIACSADSRYLPHVSAMLHSLLTHTTARPLRVWLMHGQPLPADGCERVESVVTGLGGELELLQVPEELMAGFPTSKFHYSCWYRILLPNMLPELDRVLYLDCDIIVTDDLEPLWSTDLEGKPFAACINPLYRPMFKPVRRMGVLDHRDYLNSGVLLLDMVRMREEAVADHLRAYAIEHPDNACPEQDALSVTMPGRWLSLHPRWNVQTGLLDLPRRKLPFPAEQVQEAVTRPAVVHYNGPFKPWQHHCRHPLRGLYFDHLRETSWPVDPEQDVGWAYRLMRPLSVSLQYRVLLYLRPPWLAVKGAVRRVLGAASRRRSQPAG